LTFSCQTTTTRTATTTTTTTTNTTRCGPGDLEMVPEAPVY